MNVPRDGRRARHLWPVEAER